MRFNCAWGVGAAKTFRNRSFKLFDVYGRNLQNFSEAEKKVCKPKKGKIFIQRDVSGAEAVIVGFLCRPGPYRDLSIYGVKHHSYIAAHLYRADWKRETNFNVDHLLGLSIKDLSVHPQWKEFAKLIKATDSLEGKARRYYIGKKTGLCMHPKTEVLTKNGWVCMESKPAEIAVWNANSFSLIYESVSNWHEHEHEGKLLHVYGKALNQLVTPNHKLPYEVKGNIRDITAEDLKNKWTKNYHKIPGCGFLKQEDCILTDNQIRLLVAVQADASYEFKRVRANFAKTRKIERFRNLLNIEGISYTIVDHAEGTQKRFSFEKPYFLEDWLPDKIFNWNLLQLSARQIGILFDELFLWDGHIQDYNHSNARQYFSSIYRNVEILQTLAHLVGKQGIISRANKVYRFSINQRKYSYVGAKPEEHLYKGKVYCPTVSTGYFITRYCGYISITHNSYNYEEGPNTFRLSILKESEGKVVLTNTEAELFRKLYLNFMFPEIPDWQESIKTEVRKNRVIHNLYGFPFTITSDLSDKIFRECIAWKAQSTIGVLGTNGFVETQEWSEKNKTAGCDVLNNVHDSVVVQCYPEAADDVSAAMAKALEVEFTSPYDGVKFRMKTEESRGYNLAKKTEDNPDGLEEIK